MFVCWTFNPTSRVYNELTKEYDKNVRIGLYVSRDFRKGEVVAEFIGQMKSALAYHNYMVNTGRGGYAIYINEDYVLDCYKSKNERRCFVSFANRPKFT